MSTLPSVRNRASSVFLLSLAFLLAGGLLFLSSYTHRGIIFILLDSSRSASEKLVDLKEALAGWGVLAPAIFTLIVVVEVIVAPIPGALLYAPGGALFGGFLGGSCALLGNVIGAALAWFIARAIGRGATERLAGGDALEKYGPLLERHGAKIVFLLRVNPLTSSDLVSYAAGLIGMPLDRLLIGTFFGLLPLCFLQAYLASELFAALPSLIYPFIALSLAYLALGAWLVFRARGRKPGDSM
jgi:uncharacterized membrane protein YdjX (TVP38/TMEM64 family)